MKGTKVFVTLAALAASTWVVRADDYSPTPSVPVAQRLMRIDLDVAIRHYEKLQDTLRDSRLELLVDGSSQDSNAAKQERLQRKIEILAKLTDETRQEVLQLGQELEKTAADARERMAAQAGVMPGFPGAMAMVGGAAPPFAGNVGIPGMAGPGAVFPLTPGSVLGAAAGVAGIPAGLPPAAVNQPTHLVQPGETIFSIARQYGVAAGSLQAANPEVNVSALQVGQTLRIGNGGLVVPALETLQPVAPPVLAMPRMAPEALAMPAPVPIAPATPIAPPVMEAPSVTPPPLPPAAPEELKPPVAEPTR